MSAISGYAGGGSYGNYAQSSVRQRPSEEDMAAMKKEMFGKADADGSGGLSKAELGDFLSKGPNGNSVDANAAFSSFDSNGDGSVSEDEMDEGMKSMHDQMKSNMHKARFNKDSDESYNADGNSSKNIMSSLDADGDGKIDEKELTSGLGSTKIQQMISSYIKQMSSSYSTGSDSLLSALTA